MLLDAAGREIRFAEGIYDASYRTSPPEYMDAEELPANFRTGPTGVKFDGSSSHEHTIGSPDWVIITAESQDD
jgi:hypothetical protein